MNISQAIITSINESALLEKASIDWNNYLTPEEIDKFLSKDDKVESAENIIYSKEFKPRYKDLHNDLQKKYKNSWTKRELVKDLADFYCNGHLITESIDKIEPIIMPIKLFKYYLKNNQINLDNTKVIASTSLDETLEDIDDNNKIILKYDDNANSFNENLANQIVDFVNNKCNSNDTIYILCDAGESRSTAIAAALLMKYNGNDDIIWNNPKYNPNSHVYKILLDALGIKISDDEIINKVNQNKEALHNIINNSRKITESIDYLWKSQIDKKDKYQLETYIDKLYKQLRDYEETDIKSNKYYNLLDKIEYIEAKLGNKPKIGRELH